MGLFDDFKHAVVSAAHGLKTTVKTVGTGLYDGVLRPVYDKGLRPVYNNAIRPAAVGIGNKAAKYEKKAEDFADASIDTVVGTQQAIAAVAKNASTLGVQIEDSLGKASKGVGSFLESGISWYLLAGGGAIVALLVLRR